MEKKAAIVTVGVVALHPGFSGEKRSLQQDPSLNIDPETRAAVR
jgi:hypothetical protein